MTIVGATRISRKSCHQVLFQWTQLLSINAGIVLHVSKPSHCFAKPRFHLQADFKPFKTLPPIKVKRELSLPASNNFPKCKQTTSKREWVRPSLPKPFVVQLTAIACTHENNNFQRVFHQEYQRHFIDK